MTDLFPIDLADDLHANEGIVSEDEDVSSIESAPRKEEKKRTTNRNGEITPLSLSLSHAELHGRRRRRGRSGVLHATDNVRTKNQILPPRGQEKADDHGLRE